jgi:hypothetical protein
MIAYCGGGGQQSGVKKRLPSPISRTRFLN